MLNPGLVCVPQARQTAFAGSKALEESALAWASLFPQLKAEVATIFGAVSLQKEPCTPQSIPPSYGTLLWAEEMSNGEGRAAFP